MSADPIRQAHDKLMQRVIRMGDESIVYFLDRKPFLRVWPVTVTSLPEAPQILQANQRIERIREQ